MWSCITFFFHGLIYGDLVVQNVSCFFSSTDLIRTCLYSVLVSVTCTSVFCTTKTCFTIFEISYCSLAATGRVETHSTGAVKALSMDSTGTPFSGPKIHFYSCFAYLDVVRCSGSACNYMLCVLKCIYIHVHLYSPSPPPPPSPLPLLFPLPHTLPLPHPLPSHPPPSSPSPPSF